MNAKQYVALLAVLVIVERAGEVYQDPGNTKLDLPPQMMLANTSTDTGSSLAVTDTFTGTQEYVAPDSLRRPSWSDSR
jgi:hypothetical protein